MIKKLELAGMPPDVALDAGEDPRLPYEAPRLEWEGLFEVLALSCGKVDPRNFNCGRVPRMS